MFMQFRPRIVSTGEQRNFYKKVERAGLERIEALDERGGGNHLCERKASRESGEAFTALLRAGEGGKRVT